MVFARGVGYEGIRLENNNGMSGTVTKDSLVICKDS